MNEEQVECENLLLLLTSKEEEQVLLGLQLRKGVKNRLLEDCIKNIFDFLKSHKKNHINDVGCTYDIFSKKKLTHQTRILCQIRNHSLYHSFEFTVDKFVNLSFLGENVLKRAHILITKNVGITELGSLGLNTGIRKLNISNNEIPFLNFPPIEALSMYNCNVRQILNVCILDTISIVNSMNLHEDTIKNITIMESRNTISCINLNFTGSNIVFGDELVDFLSKNIVKNKVVRRFVINLTETPMLRTKKFFYRFLNKIALLIENTKEHIESDMCIKYSVWRKLPETFNNISLIVGKSYNEKKMGGIFSLMEEFGVYISKFQDK